MGNQVTDEQLTSGQQALNDTVAQYENAHLPQMEGAQGPVSQGAPNEPELPNESDQGGSSEVPAPAKPTQVESEPTETTETPAAKDIQRTQPTNTVPGSQTPPPGSALAKFGHYSTVTPGGKYDGITVPPNAHFVVANQWFDAEGVPLVDAPILADGSVNRMSSAYLAETENEYLKMGMPGVMVQELMGNLVQQSNAIKDFQLKASDDILNQQALAISNKRAGVDLVKSLANNVAEAAQHGQKFGMLAYHALFQNLGPKTDALIASVIPNFNSMNPAQQYQAMVSMGTAAGTEQAQRQENVAMTQQNIQTTRQNRGLEASGAIAEVTTDVAKEQTKLNMLNGAIQLASRFPSLGKPGATLGNWWNDIGQNPNWSKYKALLSVQSLEAIKNSIGSGNRLSTNEYNTLRGIQVNENMPMSAVVELLNYQHRVQEAQYKASLTKAKNVGQVVKQNNSEVNASPAIKAGSLSAPMGMNQVKFLRWANQHGIYGANATAAWKHYQTLKE